MALPETGSLSLSNVNEELLRVYNYYIHLNEEPVRSFFAKPTGTIKMSDGYGKSAAFEVETTEPVLLNLNVKDYCMSHGWNESSPVHFIVGQDTQIRSANWYDGSCVISGQFPHGIVFENRSVIIGCGGYGGNGGNVDTLSAPSSGGPGSAALTLDTTSTLVIINNGYILGGGGGGGGGGYRWATYLVSIEKGAPVYETVYAPGGGGGGGQGTYDAFTPGGGGLRNTSYTSATTNTNGSAGAVFSNNAGIGGHLVMPEFTPALDGQTGNPGGTYGAVSAGYSGNGPGANQYGNGGNGAGGDSITNPNRAAAIVNNHTIIGPQTNRF